jgi:hypothetical protein
MKKVLVIGMSADMANRRAFETAMTAALQSFKVEATPSSQVLPEGKVSEDELRAKVKEAGYDGVVITRLVSVDEQTDYVPPSLGCGRRRLRLGGLLRGLWRLVRRRLLPRLPREHHRGAPADPGLGHRGRGQAAVDRRSANRWTRRK